MEFGEAGGWGKNEKASSLNMAIEAAKGMGIKVTGLDSNTFSEHTEHLILEFIWQILRKWITNSINIKDTPQIKKLARSEEELKYLERLKPEDILIKWVNYHLKKAG